MGDKTYEYVVVGSGAGGAVVAGRLAQAGHTVLLLEAGDDPLDPRDPSNDPLPLPERMPEDYSVPAFHAMAVENEATRWDMRVRHYKDDDAQKLAEERNGDPAIKGILYPRASALGGCTTHHAMVTLAAHHSDWDEIAESIGDPSWSAANMRRYFERVENCRHRRFWRLIYKLTGLNFLRHGYDGWLSIEKALPPVVLRDKALPDIVATSALKSFRELKHPIRRLRELFLSKLDPNDGRLDDQAEGIHYAPLSTRNHERKGPREFLREIATTCNGRLTIELNALVTKVVFDESKEGPKKAIGVDYLKGKRLYRACADPSTTELQVRCRANASREVILSAGAFNTPQILMLSGIGPREHLEDCGIEVLVDLPGVGQNLQDRYEVGVVYRLNDDWDILKGAEYTRKDPQYKEWAQSRSGVFTSNGIALGIRKRSLPTERLPDLFIFAVTGKFRGYFDGWSELTKEGNYLTWTILKAHTKNRAGTVQLKSDDPRDTPLINFHYFKEGTKGGQRDLDAMVAGIEFVRELSKPICDFIDKEERPGERCTGHKLKEWVESEAWGHHASCTCPIGPPGDDMAVLDKDFQVRGTEGLRVVDASVFPKIPGFFIVTQVYTIAEKASDVILANAQASTSPSHFSQSQERLLSTETDEDGARQPRGVNSRFWPAVGLAFLIALPVLFLWLVRSPETLATLAQQFERLTLLPGAALPLALVLLVLSLGLTLWHSIQELKGHMWRYVGAIEGTRIPGVVGFLIFFIFLTTVLWMVGFLAILGYPLISDTVRMFFVGGLIGARVSDSWWLHIQLDRKGYRPNPGLSSTPWYLTEAPILAVLFFPGILAHWLIAPFGFLAGWLAFYTVLPLTRLFANISPGPLWQPRTRIPASAQ